MYLTKSKRFIAILAVFSTLSGCSPTPPEIKWDYSDKEVTGGRSKKEDRIALDIYVDATTSMEGFSVSNASNYSQFLDQLETSALSAWKNADAKFYKFGETIRPIDRTAYLSAKSSPDFYHEKGVFMKTYIDSVVKRTDTSRLSVLVTDLFQDEGDVNTMVEKFKEKCFANGVAVGIIGVKSDFKGKVYDVPAYPRGYDLDSRERPFYGIVFGNLYNMQLLFDALKTKSFVQEDQFLIVSPYIIKSYHATLVKNRESVNINNKESHTGINYSFDFMMKKEGKEGKLDLSLDLDRNGRCADFSASDIELVAFKKWAYAPTDFSRDSASTDDISIGHLQRTGNKITATLLLKNEDKPGNFSYIVYLKANPLHGLVTPAWIKEFSTDNPIPGTPSGSKTYNLEKLSSALLVANASVSPTYLAKIYINIFKR